MKQAEKNGGMSSAERAGRRHTGRPVALPPCSANLIQSMRHVGYTPDTALADILDNSITAGAKRISVQFRWNGGESWFAILDDGCGMSKAKLHEAMRFAGDTAPDENHAIKLSDEAEQFTLLLARLATQNRPSALQGSLAFINSQTK